MSKPRVVEVKKPPAKPKIIKQIEPVENIDEQAEAFSQIVPVDVVAELRKQQLRDAIPSQPPFSPLNVDPDVMEKIKRDRRKRRGLTGDFKDALGLK
ncbi:MAG: hypothetical protein V1722_02760 [Candidatus Micrarchaeota archaeon]